jgi:hypothetical protein
MTPPTRKCERPLVPRTKVHASSSPRPHSQLIPAIKSQPRQLSSTATTFSNMKLSLILTGGMLVAASPWFGVAEVSVSYILSLPAWLALPCHPTALLTVVCSSPPLLTSELGSFDVVAGSNSEQLSQQLPVIILRLRNRPPLSEAFLLIAHPFEIDQAIVV